LVAFGWSDRVEAAFSPLDAAGLVPARVVNVDRGVRRVMTTDGARLVVDHHAVVGDWLGLDGDRVAGHVERWSSLERLDPDGRPQVLAANVDLVLIAAPADRLSIARVERELVIAWDSGARPVVVVTKADVADPDVMRTLTERLVTAEVVTTSSMTGDGLDRLQRLLTHPYTAVLIGPSGAGKSTLVNALLGEDRLAVGDVRDDDRRGRHTTTSRWLVPVPTGGTLIDTPGLRSLATAADDSALASAFPDIDELAEDCRFGDCRHGVEPGCAVLAAVDAGALGSDRLGSYRKLQREIDHEHRRVDPVARKAEQQVWKAITRSMRTGPKRPRR
jgi:ribosome biogenesis GTPase / thiamine phosphate phosphatase